MRSTTVVVVGAGQAGLTMSHHLTRRSIDHVLLAGHLVDSLGRRVAA